MRNCRAASCAAPGAGNSDAAVASTMNRRVRRRTPRQRRHRSGDGSPSRSLQSCSRWGCRPVPGPLGHPEQSMFRASRCLPTSPAATSRMLPASARHAGKATRLAITTTSHSNIPPPTKYHLRFAIRFLPAPPGLPSLYRDSPPNASASRFQQTRSARPLRASSPRALCAFSMLTPPKPVLIIHSPCSSLWRDNVLNDLGH